MPYIVKSFVQEKLIPAVDLVKLINQYVPLKRAGASWKACCPFHNEKTPSFSVHPSRNVFRCFGCNASGNALDFLMQYKNLGFVEAVEELAHFAGIEVEYEKSGKDVINFRDDNSKKLYEIMDRAATFFTKQLELNPQAKEYFIKQRGLSEELIVKARLGFAPDSWDYVEKSLIRSPDEYQLCVDLGLQTDRYEESKHVKRSFFRGRVMFPIFDKKGRIIAFGGRIFNHDYGPKYLNSPETAIFKKRSELFGLFETLQAHRNRPKRIVVVEGYMDAIALRQAGFDYVVATLGTAITQEHLKTLLRFTDQVICCFDGDEAGKNATWRAIKAITPVLDDPEKDVRFVNLPAGHDPDTLVRTQGAQAFEQELAMSISYSECILLHESKLLDVGDPSERVQYINRILSIIKAMKSQVLQVVTLQMLADYVNMTLPTIQEMFKNPALEANHEFLHYEYSESSPVQNNRAKDNYYHKANGQLPKWAERNGNQGVRVVPVNRRSSNYLAKDDYYYNKPNSQGSWSTPAHNPMPQNNQAISQRYIDPRIAQAQAQMQNQIMTDTHWPQGGNFIPQSMNRSPMPDNNFNQGPWGQPDYAQFNNPNFGRQVSVQEISQDVARINIARNFNSPAGIYMNLGPSGAPLNAGNQMRASDEFNGEYFEGGRGPRGNVTEQANFVPITNVTNYDPSLVSVPYISDNGTKDHNFTLNAQERATYKSVIGRDFSVSDIGSESYRLLGFILQFPTIVANYYELFKIDEMLEFAKALNIVEYPCLQRVFALIKSKPTISCAGIIEEYRGTDFEPLFNYLMNLNVLTERESDEEFSTQDKAHFLANYIFYTLKEPLLNRINQLNTTEHAFMSNDMLDELKLLQNTTKYTSIDEVAKEMVGFSRVEHNQAMDNKQGSPSA